jgi:hypothetical protein
MFMVVRFWSEFTRRQRNVDEKSRRDLLFVRTAMVGGVLAALFRNITEIDDVAPVHSRTYRKIVSAAGVLCADRMLLFVKACSSDRWFQQGCRRIIRRVPTGQT